MRESPQVPTSPAAMQRLTASALICLSDCPPPRPLPSEPRSPDAASASGRRRHANTRIHPGRGPAAFVSVTLAPAGPTHGGRPRAGLLSGGLRSIRHTSVSLRVALLGGKQHRDGQPRRLQLWEGKATRASETSQSSAHPVHTKVCKSRYFYVLAPPRPETAILVPGKEGTQASHAVRETVPATRRTCRGRRNQRRRRRAPLCVHAGFRARAGNTFTPKAKETARPLEASRTARQPEAAAHPGLLAPQGTPLSWP